MVYYRSMVENFYYTHGFQTVQRKIGDSGEL